MAELSPAQVAEIRAEWEVSPLGIGWPEQIGRARIHIRALCDNYDAQAAQIEMLSIEAAAARLHVCTPDIDLKATVDAQARRIAELESQPKWRCFNCGFDTSDEALALAHFGDRDDPEECKPLCRWWQNMTPEERGDALQDVICELNGEREESGKQAEELRTQAAEIERLKAACLKLWGERNALKADASTLSDEIGRLKQSFSKATFDFRGLLEFIRAMRIMGALTIETTKTWDEALALAWGHLRIAEDAVECAAMQPDQAKEQPCTHDRLDEDRICRQCGADKRGA